MIRNTKKRGLSDTASAASTSGNVSTTGAASTAGSAKSANTAARTSATRTASAATAASATDIIAIFTENGVALDTGITDKKQGYANESLLSDFGKSPYKALLYFGFEDKSPLMSVSLTFLHGVTAFFVEKLSKNPDIEITRSAAPLSADEAAAILQKTPYSIGAEYVNAGWLSDLWDGLARALEAELAAFDGTAAQFLLTHNSHINTAGRVFFHLVENKSDDYPFAFLATYSRKAAGSPERPDSPDCPDSQDSQDSQDSPEHPERPDRPDRPVSQKAEHVPLKNALLEYKDNQELLLQLLSTVSRAADASDFISDLVESGELFSPLRFDTDDAYTFLKEIPLYEECGVMCRMPDWWKKKYNTVKVSVSIGENPPSRVGLDALLSYKPSLVFDGAELAREELEALMSQTAGLSLLKGKWVEIDHDKLREILDAYDRASGLAGEMSLADAMRMQMGLVGADVPIAGDTVEITNGQWLSGIMDSILMRGERMSVSAGADFKAALRHYQQDGLDWLATMKSLGFGALLADDMGLGKTIQTLALLDYLRQNEKTETLLIIPASLIGNWRAEIERFAPKLRYRVLHANNTAASSKNNAGAINNNAGGDSRSDCSNISGNPAASSKNNAGAINNNAGGDSIDVCITTYGMAARLEWLKERVWDLLIIDEAQAIKNPGTKQTKAVKAIPAKFHVAMTGTPVENRLSDLWSIFDFLNAGLLGTSKEFSDYAKRIQDSESYAKLRRVISPFIMRRLKTDKSIICDLPDKVEYKVFAELTKKQAVLYAALVKELEERLYELEGIERKGVVLASIMKFKQICNHPDQYLGQSVFDGALSGKFGLLGELCETISEKRERVLVFTQFREMCEPLSDYLGTLFHKKGLVLHGGTPVKKRAELVEKFNGGEYVPYMVLSLKAGGVGLNLTAANHVIHFDRWWNPAVENQATDRAFRIGQKKNVLVHKFVTAGTVEEKIDAMIEDKLKLSGELVAAGGESWITEMGSAELLDLFRLDAR